MRMGRDLLEMRVDVTLIAPPPIPYPKTGLIGTGAEVMARKGFS